MKPAKLLPLSGHLSSPADMVRFSAFTGIILFALVPQVVHSASVKQKQPRPNGFGTAKRAIIIGIDGLGGLYLKNTTKNFTTFKNVFVDNGSYTFEARGVYPTSSGPNWSSFLTGMGVMEHGIFNNGWNLENGNPVDDVTYSIPPLSGRGLPATIFTQVKKRDPNLKTALMFTWKWLGHFVQNNTDIDDSHWAGSNITCGAQGKFHCLRRQDDITTTKVIENLKKNDPILTFVHWDSLDAAGHGKCWGCPTYYSTLKEMDLRLRTIIDVLTEEKDSSGKSLLDQTFIAIVSDHGGWKKTHGYGLPFTAVVDIPILFHGPGVLRNNSLEHTYVSNLDVAATVLNAIGVEGNEFMKGRVVEEIYSRGSNECSKCLFFASLFVTFAWKLM